MSMNTERQDSYRKDLQRLADWPRRFKGEGPFLPTRGYRTSPLIKALALVVGITIIWNMGMSAGQRRAEAAVGKTIQQLADRRAADITHGGCTNKTIPQNRDAVPNKENAAKPPAAGASKTLVALSALPAADGNGHRI